jgi:hypothetical protein
MRVRVDSYAGYKANQHPLRFYLQGHLYEVEEVLDRWYESAATYFKVRAGDGNYYILRHWEDPMHDSWTLESFRRAS